MLKCASTALWQGPLLGLSLAGFSACGNADRPPPPDPLETNDAGASDAMDDAPRDAGNAVTGLCDQLGPLSQITANQASDLFPALAATHLSQAPLGITWTRGNSPYFRILSDTGDSLSDEVAVSDVHNTETTAIAFNGRQFGLMWRHRNTLMPNPSVENASTMHYALLGVDAVIQQEGILTNVLAAAEYPAIAAIDQGWLTVWTGERGVRDTLIAAPINTDGVAIRTNIHLNNTPENSIRAALIGVGDLFAAAWEGETPPSGTDGGSSDGGLDADGGSTSQTEIYFNRFQVDFDGMPSPGEVSPAVDPNRTLEETKIRLTFDPAQSASPDLVWSDDAYVVAWSDTRDDANRQIGQIYVAGIDVEGNKLTNDIRISDLASTAREPKLAWNGAVIGLTWTDDNGIQFVTLDRNLEPLQDPQLISQANSGFAGGPSLAWTGLNFALTWHDRIEANNDEIFFRSIFCFADSELPK